MSGQGDLLAELWSGDPRTTSELARATGLARSTVRDRLGELDAAGLLLLPGRTPSGGRPAAQVRLDPSAGALVTVWTDADAAHVVVADLLGVPRGSAAVRWTVDEPADLMGRLVVDTVDTVLPGAAPEMVALGTRAGPGERMLRDGGAGFTEVLASSTGADVVVRPLLGLAALGEAPAADVLYIVADVPVGAASVVDGDVVRGADGRAGAVGSLCFPFEQDVTGGAARTLDEVVAQALADPDDPDLHRTAGRHLGTAVAALAAILAPQQVVVAARPVLGAAYLAGVRAGVYARMPPARALDLSIRLTDLDLHASIARGGSTLLHRLCGTPERLDRLLAAR